MKKYPLDLEQCYEACRKDYERNGKEFDSACRDFIKEIVKLANNAYYRGFADGANVMKGGVAV